VQVRVLAAVLAFSLLASAAVPLSAVGASGAARGPVSVAGALPAAPPARAVFASRHAGRPRGFYHRSPRPASVTPSAAAAVPAPPPTRWDEDLHAHPPRGAFRRFFRMTATAYTPINTRMEGGRRTVTRRDGRSAHGVAVDPDLIPLGSRVWIPGYGHAIADDIGGRIRGHRVDVRVQDYANMEVWGVRKVRVYVLEDPEDDG
jgi:3D (Asp-Asp-Asp) domain-containing protein